jgi:uncharacterized protein (TIGR03083 family)
MAAEGAERERPPASRGSGGAVGAEGAERERPPASGGSGGAVGAEGAERERPPASGGSGGAVGAEGAERERQHALRAFGAEAARLGDELSTVTPAEWTHPTGCPPWTVAGLLGHVLTGVSWLPGMLADEAPDGGLRGAAQYFVNDERFGARTNENRISLAAQRAASARDGRALTDEFVAVCRDVVARCAAEPADRVVRTRHGDAMRLTDYLVTRVLELGVHGFDLAAALDRPPWLTAEAAEVLTGLYAVNGKALGVDDVTLLRKVSGRLPLTATERATLDAAGITWLALG